VEGAVLALFRGADDGDGAVLLLDIDSSGEGELKFAFGAFDRDGGAGDAELHLGGKRDWFETNS
jgi:hypothetical protein